MELDVRLNSEETPTQIRYGDDEGDVVRRYCEDILYVARLYEGAVSMADIDNLIKALQNAKELWT